MRVSIVTADGTTTYTEQIDPIAQTEDFSTVLDEVQESAKIVSKQADATASVETSNGTMTLQEIFQKAADTYGVDVNLLKAIAKQESNFQIDATSHSGAQGLMQLMPTTAEGLGVVNAYDPYENVMGGAKLISKLLEQYNGDVSLALAAYNAGSGNVAKYGGIPPYEETQNYVVKVQQYYQEGVSIPDVTVSSDKQSKEEAAKQLATLFAEMPKHDSYQSFVEQMQLLEAIDKKEESTEDSDAYTAYRRLLGNTNQVVLNMISTME